MQLTVLGLGISEFLAASNVVISAGLNTSGIEIWNPSLKTFCGFNGLMAQTFLVQSKGQNIITGGNILIDSTSSRLLDSFDCNLHVPHTDGLCSRCVVGPEP